MKKVQYILLTSVRTEMKQLDQIELPLKKGQIENIRVCFLHGKESIPGDNMNFQVSTILLFRTLR